MSEGHIIELLQVPSPPTLRSFDPAHFVSAGDWGRVFKVDRKHNLVCVRFYSNNVRMWVAPHQIKIVIHRWRENHE